MNLDLLVLNKHNYEYLIKKDMIIFELKSMKKSDQIIIKYELLRNSIYYLVF